MKTLQDLFENQLKDLYSAENQLLSALPKMLEHANDKSLQQAFENHLKETKVQKSRIERICEELDSSPKGETCQAMEGLVKEATHFISAAQDDEVMDAGLIAAAQRIAHYEISGYGTAVRFAKELAHHEMATMLQTTLDEKYDADNVLDKLAENRLNKKAISQG